MSMRDIDRLKVIQAVTERRLAQWLAAERLGITVRQVRRLALRLQEDGPSGLISRKHGRPSNRQLPPGLEARIRGLVRDTYADFGPTLACEKLRERHGILLIYRSIISQSKDYVTVLERINAVGMAVQVLSNIPDASGELRHTATADLAKQLLHLCSSGPPKTTSADGH